MRRGIAGYAIVALLGVAIGAAGTWMLRRPHYPLDAVTTHGEWIRIASPAGDSIRAYVAYPERKDPGPGIIVIHEIFGLSSWEPTVADKLAAAGYVAIVPDLLSSRYGMTPADPDSGRKLTATLVPDQITGDLNVVYAWLNAQPATRRDDVATIGFCWGGGQSFRYATNNPNLKAAAVCYGPSPDSAGLARVHIPVLGVYGEDDARITAALPTVVSQLEAQGVPFPHDSYPGTGHGFLKPGRRGSDGDQPAIAWERILAFFQKYLGP
jgi:carboxymethylenebutenolidase